MLCMYERSACTYVMNDVCYSNIYVMYACMCRMYVCYVLYVYYVCDV